MMLTRFICTPSTSVFTRRLRLLALAAGIVTGAALAGCSSAPAGNGATVDAAQQKRAWQVGHDDAEAMLDQCKEPAELRLRLLEVRSRITTIRTHVSPEAADDYEQGFRTALEQRGDTLAHHLFN
ncbi:MAG: hypothetical protein NC187_01220 [Candidatus Amulumruptor caecigallinarius]|nr:hypothetical protein [Candidatus Amulumruptor caecigallinarius]MCM1396096.1 hypothetical protein [Candidatus Amulumruptor caecigallinarius]MCM1453895.1 hypothetical protein [bacterium]